MTHTATRPGARERDLCAVFEWSVYWPDAPDFDPVRTGSIERARDDIAYVLRHLPRGVAGGGEVVRTHVLDPDHKELILKCWRDEDGIFSWTDPTS